MPAPQSPNRGAIPAAAMPAANTTPPAANTVPRWPRSASTPYTGSTNAATSAATVVTAPSAA